MEQINIDSYISILDNLEAKKSSKKKRKLNNLNKKQFNVVFLLDSKNITEIKNSSNNINKNNKIDIISKMYNNNLLTIERLQFIMKYCINYFNISSDLIKKLLKDEKVTLLDVIFSNFKFYNNKFILQLLLYYNNKTTISISNLYQQISKDKLKFQ